MKRSLIAAATAATLIAAPVWAQKQEGYEAHHPGGKPPAQATPAPGGGAMGSGMMGGGMMGQGMMGGGMMGRGMMGGGMMGQGMGPGGMLEGLSLSDEQQSKVQGIHDETHQKHWDLMGKMMQEGNKMRDALAAARTDRAAAEAAFKRMNELREQMFAARLDAHAKLDAVLAPEQRAKLRQRMRGGGWMMMMH